MVAAELRELAAAYSVGTEYADWHGRHVEVSEDTLRAVLSALELDTSTPEACAAALERRRDAGWTRVLPHYVVRRAGMPRTTLAVHVPDGESARLRIETEDGSVAEAPQELPGDGTTRQVDGRSYRRSEWELPDDLPTGYHTLVAEHGDREHRTPLIVTPNRLRLPARLGADPRWGLALQLYSVRSGRSWGVGDLADLAALATWAAAEHDGAFVLVNPLHAAEPTAPMQPSPYLPTTRRFANPLYARVEDIPEYAYLDDADRSRVDELGARVREELNHADAIDRDRAWAAKRAALEIVHRAGLRTSRRLLYDAFRGRENTALEDFATWSAIAERHGADWRDWPEQLRDPRSPAVAEFARGSADRVDFHRWLQWVMDEQLAATQSTARTAGMPLGVVHDLAVGVSPTGADAWSLRRELARGVTVGAPPDPYSDTGQNWDQPPWRPDRLAELAYAPMRDMIRAVLRHAGGLRVDHIIGLFRLWWIPEGHPATDGTYVRYDHDAAIGILALEAERADAVVIGEDLGNVEPWVRDHLRERGILGTSILWFEYDLDAPQRAPLVPERWREYCLASVTTHDLPPTAGYLAGEHVRLRHDLGLTAGSLDDALAADRAEQDAWLDEARRRGLLSGDPADDVAATVEALHRLLTAAPARLRCLALTDAVGDRRTQNQPGTRDEYPNWRVALTGPDGRVVPLEGVFTDPRAARLAEIVRGRSPRPG